MRYNRQIVLAEVGEYGQDKLLQAKVLVIGAGGLGAAVIPYLAAAGIGEIGIIDNDAIELSNLQRQVIYKEDAVGKSKAIEARDMALSLNSSIKVNAYTSYLNGDNAIELFEYYDIMVDATDNLNSKYLINDACCMTGKPFVYGSVYKFQGQVSVFNFQKGPSYRCLFPDEEAHSKNCRDAGVMGISVGIIGMLQANEVLKMILGIGESLSGNLLVYNLLNNEQQKFELNKGPVVMLTQTEFENKYRFQEVSDFEIAAADALVNINNPDVLFLDVRNEDEFPKINIQNGIQIPLVDLEKELSKLDTTKQLFIYCQSGMRSKKAVQLLRNNNFTKVMSITGGALKLEDFVCDDLLSIF